MYNKKNKNASDAMVEKSYIKSGRDISDIVCAPEFVRTMPSGMMSDPHAPVTMKQFLMIINEQEKTDKTSKVLK